MTERQLIAYLIEAAANELRLNIADRVELGEHDEEQLVCLQSHTLDREKPIARVTIDLYKEFGGSFSIKVDTGL
jgi:hypothetical protein